MVTQYSGTLVYSHLTIMVILAQSLRMNCHTVQWNLGLRSSHHYGHPSSITADEWSHSTVEPWFTVILSLWSS